MENDRPRSVQSLSVAAKMKRGRPTKAKLTEDIIASEALALMDERGWSGLTMNALASRLHVRAPSLYHYIDGQSDLIHLIRAQIVRKIETAQLAESSWQNAILTFGMSYYRAFLQHTNAIGILSVTPIQDRETFHMYECFLGALDRGGWGADRGIEILAGLEYLALGSAYAHSASDVMLNAELAEANDAPILAKFVRARVSKGNDVEPTFTRLLEDFVAMFTIEREREGVPTPQQQ
jgi:AcrR family transcriptional regulator